MTFAGQRRPAPVWLSKGRGPAKRTAPGAGLDAPGPLPLLERPRLGTQNHRTGKNWHTSARHRTDGGTAPATSSQSADPKTKSPALGRARFANIPNVIKREHLRSEQTQASVAMADYLVLARWISKRIFWRTPSGAFAPAPRLLCRRLQRVA